MVGWKVKFRQTTVGVRFAPFQPHASQETWSSVEIGDAQTDGGKVPCRRVYAVAGVKVSDGDVLAPLDEPEARTHPSCRRVRSTGGQTDGQRCHLHTTLSDGHDDELAGDNCSGTRNEVQVT